MMACAFAFGFFFCRRELLESKPVRPAPEAAGVKVSEGPSGVFRFGSRRWNGFADLYDGVGANGSVQGALDWAKPACGASSRHAPARSRAARALVGSCHRLRGGSIANLRQTGAQRRARPRAAGSG